MKLFRITKTFVRNKMFWNTEVLKILAILACENWNQFDLCACISILSLINNLRFNTLPVTDQIKVLAEHKHSVIQGQFPPCLKEKNPSPPLTFPTLGPLDLDFSPAPAPLPPQVKFFYRCYFQNSHTNFGPLGSQHFAKLSLTTNINIWNSLDLMNKIELLSYWIVLKVIT